MQNPEKKHTNIEETPRTEKMTKNCNIYSKPTGGERDYVDGMGKKVTTIVTVEMNINYEYIF